MVPLKKETNWVTVLGYIICIAGLALVLHDAYTFFSVRDFYKKAEHFLSFPIKLAVCVAALWLGTTVIRNSKEEQPPEGS